MKKAGVKRQTPAFTFLSQGIRIIEKFGNEVNKFFEQENILNLSKTTGFVKRNRKVSPVSIIESILFTNQDPFKISLNDMAIFHKIHHGIELTRQAIAKRFTKTATLFVKSLLAQMLRSSLSKDMEIFTNTNFNRILIKDSVCNQLPENLKDEYPGSGGASSKASVRIQFEYDLKNQEVIDLSPSAFNKQDCTNAKETLCKLQPNDLVIRDLGYVSIDTLKGVEGMGAWYICRLNNGMDVYDPETGEKLDFKKLEVHMKKHGLVYIEKQVWVGSKKHPIRLVIELVPDNVKEERVRKTMRKNIRNGSKTSDQTKARLGLNLFLTNCPKTMIAASEIRKIYGIRWQVELIFKAWKQNMQFHRVKKMNIDRYEFLLYTKLVMVLLTWRLYQTMDIYMFQKKRQRISVLKFYKTIFQFTTGLKDVIRGNEKAIFKMIDQFLKIIGKFLQHDDRKDRINWINVQSI